MIYYLKRISFLLSLVLFPIYLLAQVDPNLENLRNVVPPSPNASSLGRYAEWPVSLYTGVPNISIPIYEIKGRNIKLPIDISYHASGNRVGDIASWVGLGWSLNAGGLISRSVRGLPDEESYFTFANTYTDPDNFNSTSKITGGTSQHVVAAASQNGDSQQDIYTFNAMGKSYRLLLKADGSIVTMPYSNIKFQYTRPDSWTVTLDDGTKILFGGGNTYTESNNNTRYGANTGGVPYISSWYMKSIVTATGEIINFSYTSTPITQDTHFTQSDYITYKTADDGANCSILTNAPLSTHTENQVVTALSLSKIESDLTRVEFIPATDPRKDLKGG